MDNADVMVVLEKTMTTVTIAVAIYGVVGIGGGGGVYTKIPPPQLKTTNFQV